MMCFCKRCELSPSPSPPRPPLASDISPSRKSTPQGGVRQDVQSLYAFWLCSCTAGRGPGNWPLAREFKVSRGKGLGGQFQNTTRSPLVLLRTAGGEASRVSAKIRPLTRCTADGGTLDGQKGGMIPPGAVSAHKPREKQEGARGLGPTPRRLLKQSPRGRGMAGMGRGESWDHKFG
jgi:hypothetical protein